MPKKQTEKLQYSINAVIPVAIYLIFYNIFSFLFFHKIDILASLFGAIIFWIIYFLLQVMKGNNTSKGNSKKTKRK